MFKGIRNQYDFQLPVARSWERGHTPCWSQCSQSQTLGRIPWTPSWSPVQSTYYLDHLWMAHVAPPGSSGTQNIKILDLEELLPGYLNASIQVKAHIYVIRHFPDFLMRVQWMYTLQHLDIQYRNTAWCAAEFTKCLNPIYYSTPKKLTHCNSST